jgi:hypothetical protein
VSTEVFPGVSEARLIHFPTEYIEVHRENKNRGYPAAVTCLYGGDDGIRTHDLGVANAALSQLSYVPIRRSGLLINLPQYPVKQMLSGSEPPVRFSSTAKDASTEIDALHSALAATSGGADGNVDFTGKNRTSYGNPNSHLLEGSKRGQNRP